MKNIIHQVLITMVDDYFKFLKNYDEKEGLKYLSSELTRFNDLFGSYTGYSPITAYLLKKNLSSNLSAVFHASLRWNKTKVLYIFDEELEEDIKNSSLSDTENVPAELLLRCPFSSFFVQTRGGFVNRELEEKLGTGMEDIQGAIGFFATFSDELTNTSSDKWIKTGNKVLDIVCCVPANKGNYMSTIAVSMRIPISNNPTSDKKTIGENIIYTVNYDKAYTEEKAKLCKEYDLHILLQALQYVLHLCTVNDIIKLPKSKVPSFASRKKKLAANVNSYSVTYRKFPDKQNEMTSNKFINEIIVNTDDINTETNDVKITSKKAPHVRRSHWAYCWVGSKKGNDRHLELRWIRESFIHPEMVTKGSIIDTDYVVKE